MNKGSKAISITDSLGNGISNATAEAANYYGQALHEFGLYRGDPVATIDLAIEAAPDFTDAYLLKAWLFATATEPLANEAAKALIESAKRTNPNEREAGHVAALDQVVTGNWSKAAITLDRHNMNFPLDLLAIQTGHLIDFYRGNARNLRDRINRVLPFWSADMPGYSNLIAMQAFGLEETGDYHRAEEAGNRALEMEPLDSWAHHAVAHVMEMQGRLEDGIDWMRMRERYWAAEDNFFQVHNWWHWALMHIGQEQYEEALALYDTRIRGNNSVVVQDLVDASAFLWRLHVLGHDLAGRWDELSEAWREHADGRLYAFNDWHAAMAYLGSGKIAECNELQRKLEHQSTLKTEASGWAMNIGATLIRGFNAFEQKQYDLVVDLLLPARAISNQFGGSHAQRDIIDWTLMEAAVRSSRPGVAKCLANERVALRPHVPLNHRFAQRAA